MPIKNALRRLWGKNPFAYQAIFAFVGKSGVTQPRSKNKHNRTFLRFSTSQTFFSTNHEVGTSSPGSPRGKNETRAYLPRGIRSSNIHKHPNGHVDRTTTSPSVDPPLFAPRVKCLCHRTRYPDNNVGLVGSKTQERECAREWPWDRENRSAIRVHSRITRGVVARAELTHGGFERRINRPLKITSQPASFSVDLLCTDFSDTHLR
jgi:hypothetical protein